MRDAVIRADSSRARLSRRLHCRAAARAVRAAAQSAGIKPAKVDARTMCGGGGTGGAGLFKFFGGLKVATYRPPASSTAPLGFTLRMNGLVPQPTSSQRWPSSFELVAAQPTLTCETSTHSTIVVNSDGNL